MADRDLWLSPEARLLADSPGVEDFVYDGQGKRLVLPQDISVDEPLPLILIGPGKTLQLKNLKLVYAASLPACLQLGPGTHTCNKAHSKFSVLACVSFTTSCKAAIFCVMHHYQAPYSEPNLLSQKDLAYDALTIHVSVQNSKYKNFSKLSRQAMAFGACRCSAAGSPR